MRIEIPQIFWHGDRDRIMSLDFYPNTNLLITCGAESEDKSWVKLWEIIFSPTASSDQPILSLPTSIQSDVPDDTIPHIKVNYISDLSGAHTATVNIARFSPNGAYLATGGDDSAIVIWVQKSRPIFGTNEESITWSNYKILRGHLSDIYDLCWSPDSKYLVSGSVDNQAIVWNVEKAKGIQRFTDHSHFVQGVSWDPRGKYVVTQSSDKSVRFYKNAKAKQEMKFFYLNQMKRFEKVQSSERVVHNNNNSNSGNHTIDLTVSERKNENIKDEDKMEIDDNIDININNSNIQQIGEKELQSLTKEKEKEKEKSITYHYYFADETQCPTFVRRHSWSPDGSICLLVSGITKSETSNKLDFVVWGVSRKDFSHPLFYIPTLDKSSVCVRFCPIIFSREDKDKDPSDPGLLNLPYYMVFAIGTIDSVFIYRTDSIKPLFAASNIHYQPITDLAWNGSKLLAISSSDGYISFCAFEKDELGTPIKAEEINDESLRVQYENYLNIDITKNVMSMNVIATMVKPKKKKDENNGNNNSDAIGNVNNMQNNITNKNAEGNEGDKHLQIEKIDLFQNVEMEIEEISPSNNKDKDKDKDKDENDENTRKKKRITPIVIDK